MEISGAFRNWAYLPVDPKMSRSGSKPIDFRTVDPHGILRSGKIHPELARRVESLLIRADQEGLDLMVQQGFRDNEEQQKIFDNGSGVTHAPAGFSFHNYGLAGDIVFRDPKGQPSWSEQHDWKKLGQLGKEAGLAWGGDWKQPDRPHFQYPPHTSITQIRRLYNDGGMSGLWNSIK